MKKLLLICTLVGFVATTSFASSTTIEVGSEIEFCDDKKCDKKDCKHSKKSATASKKVCSKGKKACCASKASASKKTTKVSKGDTKTASTKKLVKKGK